MLKRDIRNMDREAMLKNVSATKAYREIIDGHLRAYPPVKRSICYCNNFYTLQFPTMLFFYLDHHLYVHGAFGPIRSWNDLTFEVPINNIYEDGSICGCDAFALSKAIDLFWNSEFNSDGSRAIVSEVFLPREHRQYYSRGYAKWKELSDEGSALELMFNQMKDSTRPFWKFLNTAISDKQTKSGGRLIGLPCRFYRTNKKEDAIFALKRCFNFNFAPTQPAYPVQGL
jgi:hypothetical protein